MNRLLHLAVVLLALAAAPSAVAHPHVWATFKSELVYAPDGSLTAIRQAFTFDDMFSAFAVQGIESKVKGQFTREELADLAEVNVSSLKEFDYFTYVTANGKKLELADPKKGSYWLDYADAVLTLHVEVPLKTPVKAKTLNVDIYDPTIFVDLALAKGTPVTLAGAPAACKLAVTPPREMTFAEGKALSQIPADQKNTTMAWGANFANKIQVTCP